MSFGFSPSDIFNLVQLTTQAYNNWKKACGEYTEITGQLGSLNVILGRLSREAKAPGSLFQLENGDHTDYIELLENSKTTVTQLNNVIVQFRSLGRSRRNNWDRLRLADKDLGGMRLKLDLHISFFNAYLSTIGVSAIRRLEQNVKDLNGMKDTIDKLAADIRKGRREGSVMTAYENDDQAIWREFRRDLISEGFSSESIRRYKRQLKHHLRVLQESGFLDEEAPSSPCGSVEDQNFPPGLGEELLPQDARVPPSPHANDYKDGEQQATVHSSHLDAVVADEWIRMRDGLWTSTKGKDSSSIEEPGTTTEGGEPSIGNDDALFPTTSNTSTFVQDSNSIWSPIRDEGNSADSWDEVTDLDTAVEDEEAETSAVIYKVKKKRYSAVPHDRTSVLPDGWFRRLDRENGSFYVDERAAHCENKVFFLPPVAEKYPESPLPGGWKRIESVSGRIHWLHESGLVSYDHPGYSDCIRIGCISHDKCMRIYGWFGNQRTSEGTDLRTVLKNNKLASWEHVGNNSRVLYDNFQLYDTTLVCQMTSTTWDERPRLISPTSMDPTGGDNDGLPPGWQKRHDFLGQIYFVHHGSNTRTSVDPRWSRGTVLAHNAELPSGWRQHHDELGHICFVEHSRGLESQTWVDPCWKEQWKIFFSYHKHDGLSD